MPVSKLKNLAILILLLANLALLVIILPNRLSAREDTQTLRRSLRELYSAQDIDLPEDVIPDTVTLYALELGENRDAAQAAASALLGEETQIDQDSTRYLGVYSSPLGRCAMSRDGSLDAQLSSQPISQDLTASARQTLKAMGFSYSRLEEPVRLRAGVYTLDATQSVLGVPVLDGQLTLTYSNGSLTGLKGVFLPGAGALTRVSDRACLSAADVLVRFLADRYALGWVGSRITAMTQGYLRSETASAATLHLTPVWRIDTDTGSYYADGLTGQLTEILP